MVISPKLFVKTYFNVNIAFLAIVCIKNKHWKFEQNAGRNFSSSENSYTDVFLGRCAEILMSQGSPLKSAIFLGFCPNRPVLIYLVHFRVIFF